MAEVLPFLERTFFGEEIFQLPQGRQSRKIPTINLQGTTLEQEEEETMKAQLNGFMSPSSSQVLDSLTVTRDFCPTIYQLMEPFVLYFAGIHPLASQSH